MPSLSACCHLECGLSTRDAAQCGGTYIAKGNKERYKNSTFLWRREKPVESYRQQKWWELQTQTGLPLTMTGATTTSGGSPVDAPVTLGDESTNSATSLRHLRSKIVEGLGAKKSSIAAIPPSSAAGGGEHAVPANVGAAGKVAGGVGFAGSLLGEVLVSYSTSTLPPGKRHSISATSAHFEELAAEAGIDLDADDINIEGDCS